MTLNQLMVNLKDIKVFIKALLENILNVLKLVDESVEIY